ncbi:MAG: cobyrinic acid a,c-diamide synthase, partial [Lachnospiraceae bacterium]|nr:cobyrinic acid a,c-diamide synthase [Lachnospiraceae bacterium]
IAVAKDEAFCFIYDENIRLLESLGAEIVEFSPIHDEKLPDDIGGLILYGGYPEIYVRELSENKTMLKSIKDAIDSKIPSLAECGGFMYLHDSINAPKSATADGDDERNVGAEDRGPKVTDAPDISYPMVGAVKGSCSKKDRLVRFGYVTLSPKEKTFFEGNDMGIKAHEFHYYDSTNNGSDANCLKASNGVTFEAGHISENNFWGFAHLYYPSNKDFALSFVNKCRKWRAERLS